jgi:metal-responsive CopG/Arc/MetJ family transcriptional regulator
MRARRGADGRLRVRYTHGMKIAVSIPDRIFEEAERLATEAHRSRSDLYARALAEYVARHAPDRVTESMNRVVVALDEERPDSFAVAAGRRRLERSDW